MKIRKFFLTVAYSGLSPVAPGTVGSLISLFFVILLIQLLHPSTIFLLTILISIIFIKQIDIYEKETKTHDSKIIVIDELVGMWFAFVISGATTDNWLWYAIFSFIYFRLFDILKPSIIGKIDKNVKGGLGVMGDDIVAGFFAGLTTSLTIYLGGLL
ncbi:MAG: phosphatidylglycerophosphatase A [Campylobacteraceae bacterium 4484_166]|nr:MAG: phosphatidylglycerophosphatase A [Campylobacteraceae bacterium 4484_166]